MAGFQKKGAKKLIPIPGTKQSVKTFQLLTTTGISSLDGLVGGGFPIGTIVLIENNDNNRSADYSKVIVNQFLSAGSQLSHDVFAADCADRGRHLRADDSELPDVCRPTFDPKEDDMKIAWRYRDQKDTKSQFILKEEEINQKIDPDNGQVTFWDVKKHCSKFSEENLLKILFKTVQNSLSSPKYVLEENQREVNVMRVALTDLDSPLMGDEGLTEMAFALKSLVRHRLAVAVITLTSKDTFLPENCYRLRKIRELCDFSFQLDTFDKEKAVKTNQHGILTVKKLPSIKSLRCPLQQGYGHYYFRSTKAKFLLERIHLPPEAEEQGRTSTVKRDDW